MNIGTSNFVYVLSKTPEGRQVMEDELVKGVSSGYVVMRWDLYDDLFHDRMVGKPIWPREYEGAVLSLVDPNDDAL